jgi:hypothetical protein
LVLTTLAAASVGLLGAAPATAIPSGHKGKIKVVSTPSGAVATAQDGTSCRTPCTLRLPLSTGGRIGLQLEGYEPQTVRVGSHVDGEIVARDAVSSATDKFSAAVNAAVLAIWGSASYKSLDARKIDVKLVPVSAAAGSEGVGLAAKSAPSAGQTTAAPSKPAYGPALPGGR